MVCDPPPALASKPHLTNWLLLLLLQTKEEIAVSVKSELCKVGGRISSCGWEGRMCSRACVRHGGLPGEQPTLQAVFTCTSPHPHLLVSQPLTRCPFTHPALARPLLPPPPALHPPR